MVGARMGPGLVCWILHLFLVAEKTTPVGARRTYSFAHRSSSLGEPWKEKSLREWNEEQQKESPAEGEMEAVTQDTSSHERMKKKRAAVSQEEAGAEKSAQDCGERWNSTEDSDMK